MIETSKYIYNYMKQFNYNEFYFKISGLNKGYYYIKLLDYKSKSFKDFLISEEETIKLFELLHIKPSSILFKKHKINWELIKELNKINNIINEVKQDIESTKKDLNKWKNYYEIREHLNYYENKLNELETIKNNLMILEE